MEIFDHLTDKTKRFLIQMNEEDNVLDDLKAEIEREKQARERLLQERAKLLETIAELEDRRDSFDDRVSTLISALSDFPPGEQLES